MDNNTKKSPRDWLTLNISEILRFSKSDLAGEIVTQTSEFVRIECPGEVLSTHQIRNLFGRIKRASTVADMQLARQYVAYVASKQGQKVKPIVSFFLTLLEQVRQKEQVAECHLFFEGIVAFHKFHHGETK